MDTDNSLKFSSSESICVNLWTPIFLLVVKEFDSRGIKLGKPELEMKLVILLQTLTLWASLLLI